MMLTEKLWYTAAIFRWQQLNVQWKQEWFAVMHKGVNNVRPTLEGSRCGNDTIATSSSLHVTDTGWWQTTKFKVLLERPGSRGSSLLYKAQQPPPIRCQCYPTISCTSVQGGAANHWNDFITTSRLSLIAKEYLIIAYRRESIQWHR